MQLFHELYLLGEKKAGSLYSCKAKEIIKFYLAETSPQFKISEEHFPLKSNKSSQTVITINNQDINGYLYENTGTQGCVVKAFPYYSNNFPIKILKNRVKGKIVVFHQNLLFHRMLQVISAVDNGAKGIILVSNSIMYVTEGLGFPYFLGHCPIPVVGITQKNYQLLIQNRGHEVQLQYNSTFTYVTGTNILTTFNASSRHKKMIVIGATPDRIFRAIREVALQEIRLI